MTRPMTKSNEAIELVMEGIAKQMNLIERNQEALETLTGYYRKLAGDLSGRGFSDEDHHRFIVRVTSKYDPRLN